MADDDADDRFIFQRLLQRVGVQNPVQVFENGEALVAHLRACHSADVEGQLPCLIFLDIKMPRLNGFEVLRWARDESALKSLPIVVLSGSDEPRDHQRAKELGATHYLTKHPSEDKLVALLRGFPHVTRAE